MKSNVQIMQEALASYLNRFDAETRKVVLARAVRKSRQKYTMTPEQRAVFARVKRRGYLTIEEYQAEDWQVTNTMFSRGWLKYKDGRARIVVGDRAPALEVRP